VKAQLGEKQNWVDSDDLAMLYHGPFSTAFYRQLHTTLHQEYRLRRAVWHLTGQVTRPRTPLRSRARRRQAGVKAMAKLAFFALALPWSRAKLWWLGRRSVHGLGLLPRLTHPENPARPTQQLED